MQSRKITTGFSALENIAPWKIVFHESTKRNEFCDCASNVSSGAVMQACFITVLWLEYNYFKLSSISNTQML